MNLGNNFEPKNNENIAYQDRRYFFYFLSFSLREREHTSRGAGKRESEAGSLLSIKPDEGLYPTTLGS